MEVPSPPPSVTTDCSYVNFIVWSVQFVDRCLVCRVVQPEFARKQRALIGRRRLVFDESCVSTDLRSLALVSGDRGGRGDTSMLVCSAHYKCAKLPTATSF